MGWYSRLFEETNELTQEKESLFSRLKRLYVITQLWLVPLEPGVTQYETVQFKCKWRIPQRIHPHLYNFIPDFKTPSECTIFARILERGHYSFWGFPSDSVVKKKKKNPPANARDACSMPGLGRFPRGGNGNPLQNSCLENPMDRGVWWALAHGVSESDVTERTHARYFFCSLYLLISSQYGSSQTISYF